MTSFSGGRASASPAAVAKWVLANYPVHETKYKSSVAAALKGLVAAGKLVKVKNSYKFTAKEQRLREAKVLKRSKFQYGLAVEYDPDEVYLEVKTCVSVNSALFMKRRKTN